MTTATQKHILAEQTAKSWFEAVEDSGLLRPGKSERALAEEIVALARDSFGITRFWHKNIVRSGPNTLLPYNQDPPDRIIRQDDILFLDFGPIVQGFEADLGRTYVLGNDPLKQKLKNDVQTAWQEAKAWYDKQAALTGAACFSYISDLAKQYGWESAGEIAGHIVGPWPHEQAGPGNWALDIHPDNHNDILQPDNDGNRRHWIMEIHFVDRINKIGAFFEQLVN